MKYPKISEYVKAIQNAGANLGRLAHLSPVLDDHEEPYHMSGDSSVVFKMQDKSTGNFYVLKCFTIDPKELSDVHLQNADEQNMTESSNSSSVKFLEKELLVYSRKKEKKYPVELMEWVDEESMGAFLAADEELLTVATDEELNEAIIDEFGVKYRKDGRKLLEAPHELDGSYSIRKGTKIICDMAFYDCKSLSSLVIPDSVIGIGYGAFEGCSSLSNIILPDSVTRIGNAAFVGCSSLKSIVIPNGVTRIGTWTFLYCCSLSNIVIPDSVTRIGSIAFQFCYSLSTISIPDSVTRIGGRAFHDCYFPNDLKQELISRFGEKIFE